MLYKKNKENEFNYDLFQNPTAEYRGAPFWAWNSALDRDQILRQIEYFKEMGFGGFHIHSRTGMATTYLSEEFMGHIKAGTQKAKEQGLLCWLYDEDRYPSGVAGGMATKDPRFAQKNLFFSRTAPAQLLSKDEAYPLGKPAFLAAYDLILDEQGYLAEYKRIAADAPAIGKKWYATVHTSPAEARYNNAPYIDILDAEAVAKFIEITYEAYAKAVGDEFDQTIPSMFTDEPSFHCRLGEHKVASALGETNIAYTWTRKMEEQYQARYGEDLLERLPELIWKKADGSDSIIKYRYYELCADLFYHSFSAQCGKWCEDHGIAFTGHIYEEPQLSLQAESAGDLLRQYQAYTLPGIDMLCDRGEWTTAKQTQSVVRQLGKEGMMSELYGVTNWDYDFRGHKFQGDWQAAMGVTVRVPHLSWMSMQGEAKRDYPASIFYQAPWYKEYRYIEDHFARLNTALTRGKPIAKVGVIHPVESYWILTGPNDQTADARKVLDEKYQTLNRWLLEGHQDFDYISEMLLSEIADAQKPRCVGQMEYDAVLVSGCQTLRQSTIDYLQAFMAAGGKVIFMGDAPAYVDGKKSAGAQALYKAAQTIDFDKTAMLQALEPCRTVELRKVGGGSADQFIYQLRQDGEELWLFAARFKKPEMPDITGQMGTREPKGEMLEIVIAGSYQPQVYDTLSGKVLPITFRHQDGKTIITYEFFASDSLLLRLSAPAFPEFQIRKEEKTILLRKDWKDAVAYRREEPNVLLLDLAEYRLDHEEWQEKEEILAADNALRTRLGWPLSTGKAPQPWVIPEEPAEHSMAVRFTIQSEAKIKGIRLALERAAQAKIRWNGKPIESVIDGWYVDESIQTVALPDLKKGENILEITYPFGKRTTVEPCYLLGEFDVAVKGCQAIIQAPGKALSFGSITHQGLPFYGGNLIYELPFETVAEGNLKVHCGKYRGALLKVALDDGEAKPLAFEPYDVLFHKVPAGKHTLKITLFGSRVNTFGCLHNCAELFEWYGPMAWRTKGDCWSYEYQLKEVGILKSPAITLNR